jgi:hypothetical protein
VTSGSVAVGLLEHCKTTMAIRITKRRFTVLDMIDLLVS